MAAPSCFPSRVITVLSKSTVIAPKFHLSEEPLLQVGENGRVARLAELTKEAAESAMGRHFTETENLFDYLVLPEPVAVDVTARTRPDVEPETLDDFHAGVSSVRAGMGQLELAEIFSDADLIDKTFHQRHPSKWRHRLVAVFNG